MADALSSLTGVVAYLVVATLAGLESAAFVGLFVPGELALLTGGYIAQRGAASLWIMMLVAAVGAIAGDSAGYEIGRRFGPRLQRSRLGRRVGDERWQRAESYLEAKGGRAVFVGRFIGVLRALVPALAGAGGMPYPRFLVWNVAGAIIWAPGVVLAGYAAGSSYQKVERYLGRATFILLGIVAVVAAIVFFARWISRHQDRVREIVERQLERTRIASLRDRYESQLRFLTDRFRPGNALGLILTVQLLLVVAAGWLFGSLLADVLGGGDAVRTDGPFLRYLADHRTPWLTTTLRGLRWVGSTAVLVPLVIAVSIAAYRRWHTWATAAQLGLSLGGAIGLYAVLKPLVGRSRPRFDELVATSAGNAFPSGQATQSAAVLVTLALLSSTLISSWARQVAVWAGATLIALLVGFTQLYLGAHWPTDVLAGYALGAVWAGLCALAFRWSELKEAKDAT